MRETQKQLVAEVITDLVKRADAELFALDEAGLVDGWNWQWDSNMSAEWNTYKFSDDLESYKRRCRRWEEHHNGISCVVERVRDKYVMPRVRGFVIELAWKVQQI